LYQPEQQGAAKNVKLVVHGLARGQHRATVWRVDATHGSPLQAYAAMGSPASPTRDQIAALQRAARLPEPEKRPLPNGSLAFTLPAQALAVVEIR
jgi:xylan 1,4-beta-xylosidase